MFNQYPVVATGEQLWKYLKEIIFGWLMGTRFNKKDPFAQNWSRTEQRRSQWADKFSTMLTTGNWVTVTAKKLSSNPVEEVKRQN